MSKRLRIRDAKLNLGFLGPKIITYDFTPHVQVPKKKF